MGKVLHADISVVLDSAVGGASLLCRDHDDSVRAPVSVNRRGGGVLEDLDGRDVLGVYH